MLFQIADQFDVDLHHFLVSQIQGVNQHVEVLDEACVVRDLGLVLDARDGLLDQPFLQHLVACALEHERKAI